MPRTAGCLPTTRCGHTHELLPATDADLLRVGVGSPPGDQSGELSRRQEPHHHADERERDPYENAPYKVGEGQSSIFHVQPQAKVLPLDLFQAGSASHPLAAVRARRRKGIKRVIFTTRPMGAASGEHVV